MISDEPKTNTLSMSEQFEMNVFDINKILKGIYKEYPSLLLHLKLRFCTYTGGDGASNISTYLEVDEDMYMAFISNMPKARPSTKNHHYINSVRERISRDYREAFIVMKSIMMKGMSTDERELFVKMEADICVSLKHTMSDFCKRNHTDENPCRLSHFRRTMFSIINYQMGVNAIDYEESRNANDKHSLNEAQLTKLTTLENMLTGSLRTFRFETERQGEVGDVPDRLSQLILMTAMSFAVNDNDIYKGLKLFYKNSPYNPMHHIFVNSDV